ncbi:MAG: 50S ribosomal protein L11 methyltransferase [Proteobacteria bacterium]|nr:50S ribosomal protein L11 methyltransferase [Desulfobacula sp.]MBU4130322.1 50S ribosomal protein L11 methyltransferase [Pseudomonadota bacterium]
MKFKKITIAFETKNIVLAEELICDIFFSLNLKGVVCNIPLEEPDEGFGTHTLPLPDQNSIVGYLPDIDASDITLEKIKARAKDLAHLDIQVKTQVEIVDEKDWEDAWKTYFNVTRITDRIVIKPEWKDHEPAPNDIVIHLDPGMAFGTGTHPTTAMCIQMIEKFLIPGSDFLDVGTGSGILMVAAAKLGAGRLTGIDTDEVAIGISKKNLDKNQADPLVFTLSCATLDQTPQKTYDLIAANIIAQVIVDIMPELERRMAPKGMAILSGIIRERKPDIVAALQANALHIVHETNEGEWVALAVTRQEPFL